MPLLPSCIYIGQLTIAIDCIYKMAITMIRLMLPYINKPLKLHGLNKRKQLKYMFEAH